MSICARAWTRGCRRTCFDRVRVFSLYLPPPISFSFLTTDSGELRPDDDELRSSALSLARRALRSLSSFDRFDKLFLRIGGDGGGGTGGATGTFARLDEPTRISAQSREKSSVRLSSACALRG